MITPKTTAFYIVRAHEDAAELITSTISTGAMSDITDALILSIDFDNEITPINELDTALETLKCGLIGSNIELHEQYNPIYYPSTDEAFDDVVEGSPRAEQLRLTGIDGNPFIAKKLNLSSNGSSSIEAAVSFREFEFPGYDDMLEKRRAPLN